MSRTISQIDIGTSVWIREGDADVEYILMRKDNTSVELMRNLCYSARQMNPQNTTVYDGCEMDQWLTDESTGFLSLFSSALRSNLIGRAISTFTYGDTDYHYIYRKCYLYSYGDMFMSSPDLLYPETKAYFPLMINKGTLGSNAAMIGRNSNGTAVIWWLRSPNSDARFWCVHANGSIDYNYASSSGYWCRPVLSVASATVVSPEGADVIYLLPEEKPRVAEFKGKLGEFTGLPKYGCIQVSSQNLTNLAFEVTNNYGDSEPVWQTVQNSVQFEFENTEKTTENYEIGIHCYGVAPEGESGYFEQPQMLVEV